MVASAAMLATLRLRSAAVALVVISLVGTACGASPGDPDTTPTEHTTEVTTAAEFTTTVPRVPTDYADFREQATACGGSIPDPVADLTFAEPEDMGLDPTATVTATIVTSCGEIVVELDPALAPETVNSFVFLASQGYFDGSVSHRVAPGFVLQAGDPTATGRGGPGYVVPDELPDAGFVYERGILAMANAGAGTTGSQFFIMLGDAALPPDYSVFGRVTDGIDTLDRIAEIPLGSNARGEISVPLETLYLEQVVIER